MSGVNRDQTWSPGQGGSAAEQPDVWFVDRRLLWGWIGDALAAAPVEQLDDDLLHALCVQALDTHAPAVLVHAQAAGVLIERLVTAAIVQAYVDCYGRPCDQDAYEVNRIRAVVRDLRRATAPAA